MNLFSYSRRVLHRSQPRLWQKRSRRVGWWRLFLLFHHRLLRIAIDVESLLLIRPHKRESRGRKSIRDHLRNGKQTKDVDFLPPAIAYMYQALFFRPKVEDPLVHSQHNHFRTLLLLSQQQPPLRSEEPFLPHLGSLQIATNNRFPNDSLRRRRCNSYDTRRCCCCSIHISQCCWKLR